MASISQPGNYASIPDMTVLALTAVILLGSLLAGFFGALTGLGGGVIIIPLLVLAFGVNIHYASGAALISVLATSSGAAAAYVRDGYSNVRIGMFLEVATTLGALVGAFLAGVLSASIISIIFGLALIYSAVSGLIIKEVDPSTIEPDPLATRLKMNGAYPVGGKLQPYFPRRVPLGFSLMFAAGALSGLLGIGSGAVKVLAMDQIMRIPFKVSTTTSNFMIGVTAAASAGVYLRRGYFDPVLCMPVLLGVLAGSYIGAKVLVKAKNKTLRIVFTLLVSVIGIQMIYKGITGHG